MIRIGITERGDVAFTNEWIDKVKNGVVSAAILISKGLPLPEGRQYMLENSNKIIFHATTTGYGGTAVEPNVRPYAERLSELDSFVKSGFPISHVVIRVDPIILSAKGVDRAIAVVNNAFEFGFRRFRYSYLDVYQHVANRFASHGWDIRSVMQNCEPEKRRWMDYTSEMESKDCVFESCAERNRHFCGCVSVKDFVIFGLDPREAQGNAGQRIGCGCCANKFELLSERHRCPFKCLYCYWYDDGDVCG